MLHWCCSGGGGIVSSSVFRRVSLTSGLEKLATPTDYLMRGTAICPPSSPTIFCADLNLGGAKAHIRQRVAGCLLQLLLPRFLRLCTEFRAPTSPATSRPRRVPGVALHADLFYQEPPLRLWEARHRHRQREWVYHAFGGVLIASVDSTLSWRPYRVAKWIARCACLHASSKCPMALPNAS